jgi:hypothetical protein
MATNPFTQGVADLPGLRSGSRKGIDAIYKAMQHNLGRFGQRLDYLDRSTAKYLDNSNSGLLSRLAQGNQRDIADVLAQAVTAGGQPLDEAQRLDLERIASDDYGEYQGLASSRKKADSEQSKSLRSLDKQYVKELKASAVKEKQAREAELENALLGYSAGLQSQSALFDAQLQQVGLNQAMLSGGGGSYTVGAASGLSEAEAYIIQRESGGNPSARNPSSGAFGIWQGNPKSGTLQQYARQFGYSPYTTNVDQQLNMFRAYVRDRYGTAEEAARFWKQNGWY